MTFSPPRVALAGLFAGLLAWAGPAEAAKDPKPGATKTEPQAASGKGKKSKAGRVDIGDVDVGGRAFVRAELLRHYEPYFDAAGVPRDRRVNSFDLSVPSARIDVRYKSPTEFLTANLELELTDEPELLDAWLRARGEHLSVQAGQFKVPFSAIEMESRWVLPTTTRGLVNDILLDHLEVAGRRPGVIVKGRYGAKHRFSAALGSFQGSVLVEEEGTKRKAELFSRESLRTQSIVARFEYTTQDLEVGAGVEQRIGTPGVYRSERYFTGGVDLTLDTFSHGRGFRLWVEGLMGDSWFEHSRKPTDDQNATFAAARMIGAVRFGGETKNTFYVEPYGLVGVLDPDTVVAFDLAAEEMLGVNAGLWRVARIGLEGGIEHLERNFPRVYGLGSNPNRWKVTAQAGVSF